MLPITYFERLSAAWKLRTFGGPRERRGVIRVDVRGRGQMWQIFGLVTSDGGPIGMREISRSGGSLTTGRRVRVGQEFVLRVRGRCDPAEYWVWCRCKRCAAIDDLFVVGFSFQKLLMPGQSLSPGTHMGMLSWLEVDGDREPIDPYEGEGRAA